MIVRIECYNRWLKENTVILRSLEIMEIKIIMEKKMINNSNNNKNNNNNR